GHVAVERHGGDAKLGGDVPHGQCYLVLAARPARRPARTIRRAMEGTPMAVRPMTAGPHLILIDTDATRRGSARPASMRSSAGRLDPPARRDGVVRGDASDQPVRNREARVTGPHLA